MQKSDADRKKCSVQSRKTVWEVAAIPLPHQVQARVKNALFQLQLF